MLRRPSKQITLWEVYEALREDGPFLMHACQPNAQCPIGGRIQRHLRGIYDATEASMERVLCKISVAALRRQVTGEA